MMRFFKNIKVPYLQAQRPVHAICSVVPNDNKPSPQPKYSKFRSIVDYGCLALVPIGLATAILPEQMLFLGQYEYVQATLFNMFFSGNEEIVEIITDSPTTFGRCILTAGSIFVSHDVMSRRFGNKTYSQNRNTEIIKGFGYLTYAWYYSGFFVVDSILHAASPGLFFTIPILVASSLLHFGGLIRLYNAYKIHGAAYKEKLKAEIKEEIKVEIKK